MGRLDNNGTLRGSFLWCSYRRGMVQIGCDQGWGCMLRCGQMLVSHALHRSSREDWETSDINTFLIRESLRDLPERPYSLQKFLIAASDFGLGHGRWFSPGTTSLLVKRLLPIPVIHSYERELVTTQVTEIAKPLMLIFTMRIGESKSYAKYMDAIIRYTRLPQFSGILGGTPQHALYIVGSETTDANSKLLAVDPHTVRDVFTDGPVPRFKSVEYRHLDPSLSVSFMCKDQEDVSDLVQRLRDDSLISVLDVASTHATDDWQED